MKHKRFLTVKDVMSKNEISMRETYNLFHQVDFPSIRIGKKLLVREDKLKEWEDNQQM